MSFGAFDEADHAVEKCFAGVGRDADHEPIGEDARAAGDAAAVAAAFANDGRAFAGDGAFVDRGDAFDDFAVAGNEVAGFDENDIVLAQAGPAEVDLTLAPYARFIEQLGVDVFARGAQCVGLSLAAAFGHRFGEIGEEHREPEPGRNAKMKAADSWPVPDMAWMARPVVRMLPMKTVNITGLRTWRRGLSLRNASTTARRTMGGSNSGRALVVAVIFLNPERLLCGGARLNAGLG